MNDKVKLEKIKTRAEIQQILFNALQVNSKHLTLYFTISSSQQIENKVTLAVIIAKRLAKRAVTRNTIRRHTYAQVYLRRKELNGMQLVFRLKASLVQSGFVSATSKMMIMQIRAEIEQLLAKVLVVKMEHNNVI